MNNFVKIYLKVFCVIITIILPLLLIVYSIFFNWDIWAIVLSLLFLSFAPKIFLELNKKSLKDNDSSINKNIITNNVKDKILYKNDWESDLNGIKFEKKFTDVFFGINSNYQLSFSKADQNFNKNQFKNKLLEIDNSMNIVSVKLKNIENLLLKKIAVEFENIIDNGWVDGFEKIIDNGEQFIDVDGDYIKIKNITTQDILGLISNCTISMNYNFKNKIIDVEIFVDISPDILGGHCFTCNLLYDTTLKKWVAEIFVGIAG